jgi:hypothetical protein
MEIRIKGLVGCNASFSACPACEALWRHTYRLNYPTGAYSLLLFSPMNVSKHNSIC